MAEGWKLAGDGKRYVELYNLNGKLHKKKTLKVKGAKST